MHKQEAIDALECYKRNTAHILGDNDEKVKTIDTCIMLVREAEEAAMEICRRMVWNGTDDYVPMSAKAIENEIRQLPPVKVCETAPSDLISRQAAIYAISKDIMGGLNYERILKELPSAEPRHNFPEKAQLSGKDTTSDCISRQAAIDALIEWYGCEPNDIDAFKEIIYNKPSVQPEQKKGEWIVRDNPGTGWYRVTCSECGEDVTSTIPMIGFFPDAKPLWDYCPDCGAKMEEEDE